MKMSGEALMVFPTELAKRRYESRRAAETGVLGTRRLSTQKRLLALCERAARRAGLLTGRIPGPADLLLLSEEAAGLVRFASGQPLGKLPRAARAGLLSRAVETFAGFAGNEPAVTEWLLAHTPDHKLHGIGQLLQAWRQQCTAMNIADRFAVNAALLRLIESGALPPELKDGIVFRAVRWFNPFEERLTAALKKRLGSENVQIISVLPDAHAQAAEKRLNATVYSELERGNEEEWKPWLEDFADAYEMDDGNILEDRSRERVSFFISAHPYGEIEDAARRIAREIETGTAPDEIALIVRELSPYTDIIPDVFQRFGVPYHFRRGIPAAAHPPVKALLALLAFPQTLSRERLCDLLLMPGIQWPGLDAESRQRLVREIRLKEPPRMSRLPGELRGLPMPEKMFTPAQFSKYAEALIKQHELVLPDEVPALIKDISAVRSRPVPSERLTVLFEELLGNVTLSDESGTESGVWIVNPMDAAGLRFKSVYLAGMDDRTFPQIPKTDSLLSDTERKALRMFLKERGIPCPRLALSETGTALIQEEILFLTAISAARERLTLSCARAGADGRECTPGEFFERMRGLTGSGKPALGESFHTILPPDACRAEDEIRQTNAKLSPPPASGRPAVPLSALQKWLETHPEFSATALESLARNRFVYFLEKILGIKPDLTHEDDIAPADRGAVVHDILEQIYTAIARQSGWYAASISGSWKLSRSGEIPLAVFDPAKTDELLALAQKIAGEEFRKAEQRPGCHLGHPALWKTEKQKLHQVIENFIRMDIETAQAENRYPAFFEMKFDARHGLPVTLKYGAEEIRLKGKMDRIDLIFNSSGELDRLLVIDYKSRSRRDSVNNLEKKIALNLDCQIPLYTFAAQQKFFGIHNTPELNEKVQAVYHLQERNLKKMANHFEKRRMTMTPELTGAFLEQLFSNIRKLRDGDLASEPLIAGYEDYSHICRTAAIDPEDL